MAWLSQVGLDASYLLGVALPMLLIGAGQGATLAPLTIAGVSGVPPDDAGSASGLVNVAHQLGGSLGLGLLVVVFAAAGPAGPDGHAEMAHRIAAVMWAGAAMLAGALIVALVCIVRSPPPSTSHKKTHAPTGAVNPP